MPAPISKVCILGGGSFGTAMATIAAANPQVLETIQWIRDGDVVTEINTRHSNEKYLPDTALSPDLKATTFLEEAVRDAELVMVAIPSEHFQAVCGDAAAFAHPGQFWISLTKGIAQPGFQFMSGILASTVPGCLTGVLSGPNLAREVAAQVPTATVIASESAALRAATQAVLGCDSFRVYENSDVFGVELAGALKNIYAIIAGMAAALSLGENTKAMLITRSLAEMSRFAVRMGANPMTFLGLAGVGDLVVTCSSPLSRNYRVGYSLGQHESVESIVSSLGQVAEGVNTTRLVAERARAMGIDMPLAFGLYAILYEQVPVDKVLRSLMARGQNSDVEFILPRSGSDAAPGN
ncbi:NAD(P)H-dependent glycerol-3-phosphate dehydrogenase [Allohahella sp. A8]|uniref:NAD(P)H-dependent glycerol-3-phosphate dehydrogenase n=1 Tax=Allohahella sp. A8 TaxID=3141461 RepID=UPI003A80A903